MSRCAAEANDCTIAFRLPHVPRYRFELRPASAAPVGAVAILYRFDGETYRQCGVGSKRADGWRSAKGQAIEPEGLFWCEMVPDAK